MWLCCLTETLMAVSQTLMVDPSPRASKPYNGSFSVMFLGDRTHPTTTEHSPPSP
jgi:hypothetical protein